MGVLWSQSQVELPFKSFLWDCEHGRVLTGYPNCYQMIVPEIGFVVNIEKLDTKMVLNFHLGSKS